MHFLFDWFSQRFGYALIADEFEYAYNNGWLPIYKNESTEEGSSSFTKPFILKAVSIAIRNHLLSNMDRSEIRSTLKNFQTIVNCRIITIRMYYICIIVPSFIMPTY